MKRWIALVLSAMMLLCLLTGCSKKPSRADEFYALADEIKQLKDGTVTLTMPYHGAVLRVDGFVSRTKKQADLTFSLEGTQYQDGAWTEVRIIDDQAWINVGQTAEFTRSYPLTESRRESFEEVASSQKAPWLFYRVEGDLWEEGIPQWKDLLNQFWQDSRADLGDYITQDGENAYLLKLEGKALEQAGGAVSQRLRDKHDGLEAGFQDFWDQQIGLKYAIPRSAQEMFSDTWKKVLHEASDAVVADPVLDLDETEEGEAAAAPSAAETDEPEDEITAVALRLSLEEQGYGVELNHNGKDVFHLTLTPAEDLTTEAPTDVMDFEDYFGDLYYLFFLSRSYIDSILDGTQEEEESDPHGHEDAEEPTEDPLMPLSTTPVEGSEGIALISYQTAGGGVMQVPVMTGYTESTVDSVNNDGQLVTKLYLYAQNWYQDIQTVDASGSPAEDAQAELDEYFDLYVEASGYQVTEERSTVSQSADGTVAVCGFSSQENPYTSAMGRLIIVIRQKDAKANTLMDFLLDLDQMTDAERDQIRSLCLWLGVEVPIQLSIS